jgi:hypothetical protein
LRTLGYLQSRTIFDHVAVAELELAVSENPLFDT